jgi:3',5'-cyclic AMP phosphodiesterase CpdA
MRIAHLTDIHFYAPPSPSDLFSLKRIMGTTNLYILGRKSKFDINVQRNLVQKVCDLKPDLVLITGDLTSQALEAEFKLAKNELNPILSQFPTRLIPGNHDVYTNNDKNRSLMRRYFGEWMPNNMCRYDEFSDVGVLLFDTCKPDLLSRGYADESQFKLADELLSNAKASFVFFCIHYPLRDRGGQRYGPSTRALRNAENVETWLGTKSSIKAILHGHEHHGFKIDIDTQSGQKTIINPGTSGYATDEKKNRRAHFNLYTLEEGNITQLERFAHHGSGFIPEPGGSYSTHR